MKRGFGPRGRGGISYGSGMGRNGFLNPTMAARSDNTPSSASFEKEMKFQLDEFVKSGTMSISFPPMSSAQRKAVHILAKKQRLQTKSMGIEPNRYIVVSIRNVQISRGSGATTDPICLNEQCSKKINDLAVRHPITEQDVEHYLKEKSNNDTLRSKVGSSHIPKVPPHIRNQNSDIYNTRKALPSFKYRQTLIDSIRKNSVVIVSGGTGCGKTTQVPQFILEKAAENNEKVRIMCTQPRRIAAISIAERVARERGERIGDTVGYHIRLEQKTSEKTILTYCTSGVLLRMLSTDSIASGITHIILDEIHERETNTDYLLIALKQALVKRNDLKIILMSATIEGNMNLFESYFNEKFVEVIRIESKLFDVHKLFLGDILAMIGYDPPESMFGCMFSASGEGDDQFPSMGVWQDPQVQSLNQSHSQMQIANSAQNQYYGQVMRHSNTEPVLEDIWVKKPQQHSYSNFQNTSSYHGGYQQQGQMQQIQPNAINCQSTFDYRTQPPPPNAVPQNPTRSPYERNECVTNSKGEWISGNYPMTDDDDISERNMLDFEAAVGGLHVRPVVTVQPRQAPTPQPPPPQPPISQPSLQHQQPQFGMQYREMASSQQCLQTYQMQGSSSQIMQPQQQQQPQFQQQSNQPNYEFGERPTFFVPSKTSSLMTTAGSVSGTGLSKFNENEDVFGASMNRGKELEKQYRADFKNAFPNRPPFFDKSVLGQLGRVNTASWNLEAKYMACGGTQYEESVDWHLVSEVIHYLADSPIFGSILVFLPGYEDISQVKQKIEEWRYGLTNYNQVNVLCLHSQMNSVDQNEIFNKVPKNVRKVILSTNIAEASVTIEDVIFVVDTGKVKEKVFRHETKFSQLKVTSIAKSNSEQRAGRAGRVTDGYCFRLYGIKEYNAMPETQLAEMQRAAIYDVCLHAKLFAPKGMRVSEFLQMAPEPPTPYSIEQSMEFLEQLGALYSESKNSNELPEGDYDESQDPELTDLGRIMAQMPLDPQLARLLIFGLALKCLNPVLNLVALLSYRDPYVIANPTDRENQNRARERIAKRDFSDHLLYIRLVDEFSKLQTSAAQRFCNENYLNFNTMRMIAAVRRQLLMELMRAKLIDSDKEVTFALTNIEYNKYSNCWPMVQAAIAAGCYPSVGVSTGNSNKLRKVQTHADSKSTLHPASVVKRQANMKAESHEKEPQLQFVVYQELSMIEGGLTLRGVTVVPAVSVLLVTGPLRLKHSVICDYDLVQDSEVVEEVAETGGNMPRFDNGYETYEIEPWYAVRVMRKDLKNLLRLRFKFMHHFLKALHTPVLFGMPNEQLSEVLEALRVVLTEENLRCQFGKAEMPDITNLRKYPPPVLPESRVPATVPNHNQNQSHSQSSQSMKPSTSTPYQNQNQGFMKSRNDYSNQSQNQNQSQSQQRENQFQPQNYFQQMTQSQQNYQKNNYQGSGQMQQQNSHRNGSYSESKQQNYQNQQGSSSYTNSNSNSNSRRYHQNSSPQQQKPEPEYFQQQYRNSGSQAREDSYQRQHQQQNFHEDYYERNCQKVQNSSSSTKNGGSKRKTDSGRGGGGGRASSSSYQNQNRDNRDDYYEDDDYDEQYQPKRYEANRGHPKGRGGGLAGFGRRGSGSNRESSSRQRPRRDSDDGWTPKFSSNPKPRGGGSGAGNSRGGNGNGGKEKNVAKNRYQDDEYDHSNWNGPSTQRSNSGSVRGGAFGRQEPSTSSSNPVRPRNRENSGRVDQDRPNKPKESSSSSSGWNSNARNRQNSNSKYKKSSSNQKRNDNGRNDDNY